MTIQDLLSTLNSARTADRRLAFTGALIGSSDLAALLEHYFDNGTVDIAEATIEPSSDQLSVVVGGTVAFRQLVNCPLAMTLTPPRSTSGDTFCAIVLTPPSGWSLPSVFPNIVDELVSVLNLLAGGIVICSGQFTEPFHGLVVQRGMTVVAQLDVAATSVLGYLAPVLGAVQPPWIAGSVTDPALPQVVLQTAEAMTGSCAGIDLSDLSLVFTLGNLAAEGETPIAVASAELQATLNLDAGGGSTVGGSTTISLAPAPSDQSNGSMVLTASTTFDNVSLASGFGLVEPLIGDADLLGSLPTELNQAVAKAAASFKLTAADLTVDTSSMTVQSADVTVAVELDSFGVFHAIPALTVSELDLTWNVDRTATPAAVTFGATAPVQITGDCTVNVGFQTQPAGGYEVTVREADGAVLNISDLVSVFAPGVSLPELDVSHLALTLQPRVSLYTFTTTISESWTAHPDFPALTEVAFDVLYDGSATPALSGSISGTATLPVADSSPEDDPDAPSGDIDLYLSAARPAGGDSWQLEGHTGLDQQVPVGDLIAALVHQFDVDGDCPDVLSSLTISNLGVSVDTGTSTFTFNCGIQLTVATEPVDVLVNVAVSKSTTTPGYDKQFTGTMLVAGLEFEIVFDDAASGSTTLVAVYTRQQGDPDQVSLRDLVSSISKSLGDDIPDGLSIGLNGVKLVLVRNSDSTNEFAISVDLSLSESLSGLPLVGSMIPSDELEITGLQAGYSSAALSADEAAAINGQLPATVSPFPATGLSPGILVAADIVVAGQAHHLVLPIPTSSSSTSDTTTPSAELAAATPGPPATGGPTASNTTHWFNVQRSVGPVSLSRVGVSYQDGTLLFLLDGALNLTVLQLGLDGLGFGTPLDHFAPVFHLDGLAISFQQGPVKISGGFLHVTSTPSYIEDEYVGELIIAIQPYLIAGVGAYAKVSPPGGGDFHPSFFVFAEVAGQFGGPPAFVITGFMGGVGYNWALTLPSPDQVYQFPFVAGLDDPSVFGTDPSPMDVLNALSGNGDSSKAVVTPQLGENWVAGGLRFTSFELIQGRALVVAAFGKEFEVALLGLALLVLPQQPAPQQYVYAELQLDVVFKPDDGVFSATASLTPNSYVIDPQCHLTGGFAFDLWFPPSPHAGDFVATLGGYHPAFQPPAWYPRVAPLGFSWAVSNKVQIKGGAYFAVTPTAGMAGGSLEVQFHDGDLHAWLTAYVNVMVRWRPFYLEAEIGIHVGASYRLNLEFTTVTVSAELGATLNLWGPPTGGKAHVDWSIISFTIGFGAGQSGPSSLTVDWSGLEALLPSKPAATARRALAAVAADDSPGTAAVLKLTVNGGLSQVVDNGTGGSDWVVRADELVLTSSSAVPITSISVGTGNGGGTVAIDLPTGSPTTIDIRPMGATGVTSAHTITITPADGQTLDVSTWQATVQTASLPKAMWGPPLGNSAPEPSAELVTGLANAVCFTPPRSIQGASLGPVDPSSLVTPLGGGYIALDPSTQPDPIPPPTPDQGSVAAVIADVAGVAQQQYQQQLVAALAGLAAAPPTSAPLVQFAAQAGTEFAEPPMLSGTAANARSSS